MITNLMYGMGGYNGFCGFGGGGIFGGFIMILVWVLLGVGIYLLVKNFKGGSSQDYRKNLKETLTEKFIAGEITKEEYEEKMAVIERLKK
jgi:uncharacterized membrane protein